MVLEDDDDWYDEDIYPSGAMLGSISVLSAAAQPARRRHPLGFQPPHTRAQATVKPVARKKPKPVTKKKRGR